MVPNQEIALQEVTRNKYNLKAYICFLLHTPSQKPARIDKNIAKKKKLKK